MSHNSICVNDGKAQYLPIVSMYADAIVDERVIRVGMVTITSSRYVQCLDGSIDRHFNIKSSGVARGRGPGAMRPIPVN